MSYMVPKKMKTKCMDNALRASPPHGSLGFIVRPWFCQVYTWMNYVLGFKELVHEIYNKSVNTN